MELSSMTMLSLCWTFFGENITCNNAANCSQWIVNLTHKPLIIIKITQSQHKYGKMDVINTYCIKIKSIGIWQSKGFSTPTTAGVASTIRDEAYIQRRDWGQYVWYQQRNETKSTYKDVTGVSTSDTTNRMVHIQRRDWGQYVRYDKPWNKYTKTWLGSVRPIQPWNKI